MKRVAPHNSSYENSQRLPHKSFLDPPSIPFPNGVEELEAYPPTASIAFNDFRETKERATYSKGNLYEPNSHQRRIDIVSTPQTFKERVLVEETDPHRLTQREKQINIGKNTVSYSNYIKAVPKEKRIKRHPQHPVTPRIDLVCSKRSFDGQVKKWRQVLYENWDSVGGGGEGGNDDENKAVNLKTKENISELSELCKEEEELEKLLQELV